MAAPERIPPKLDEVHVKYKIKLDEANSNVSDLKAKLAASRADEASAKRALEEHERKV